MIQQSVLLELEKQKTKLARKTESKISYGPAERESIQAK